ncbi:2-amino-4-hydroxy-6-hydroxymethyldihydropteridine diphosphokinase [Mucilaginibacter sp. 14171R-50]|uniref:2-amino-4-hydroxy-6- hydroxymethyldihydropteridine diphosphokinase n=1 Tax=Mucilaginibacter sp. 14171R-50 TaxID=2703789 RepID=UPI00138BCABD|nr:2-amino-4-hydroxy-6-hydroxymethyldihydropteridine diphosphokinase [Mucilaginibacter sp. 14171R-50]QHS57689.1 2-amino-4-hydroxy-6-hydroxymethyldihydropteridine diphosphokinase [Mucilaginibacter sp. 14171R-50]
MINVFLLLGSNLGDRNVFLHKAIACIEQGIAPVVDKSAVYETQSWGKTNQPDYLNQVIMLQTNLPAQQVLAKILHIETVLGRSREEKWGSRTIDIDILFYGDEVINQPNLIVPHPQLHNRRFTLEPLGVLAPGLIHPVLNKTILELKSDLKDDLIVKKL